MLGRNRAGRQARLATALALTLLPVAQASAQFRNLEATYRFLVSDRQLQQGALYQATAGKLRGAALPLSFVDSAEYWGAFVCQGERSRCAVADQYDPATFALAPERGIAGDLQLERVIIHNGASIYDAATWQIAVQLGAVINQFGNPEQQDAYRLAANQSRLLRAGYSGNAKRATPDAERAVTNGPVFRYNNQSITRGHQAYSFRILPRDWLATDPLIDSVYQSWITATGLPAANAEYARGRISWSDWKPVTGENAWAFLLGPLHAAYIHFVLGEHGNFVPFRDLAVQDALAMLPAFAAMQSQIGAVYYAPSTKSGAEAGGLGNPHLVSVENNFSLYAGLRVLKATLLAELAGESGLAAPEQAAIRRALGTIATMIDGGKLAQNRYTEGLLAFFRTKAWQQNGFVTGGLANDPGESSSWIPTPEPKAVDANTWGIAALEPKQLDQWFGFGTAFNTWQRLKSWGAYGTDKKLWGVGFSDQDGNGLDPDGRYRQGILSAEWTAGAINMVRSLIGFYAATAATSARRSAASGYVGKLRSDELAMLAGVQALRFTNYDRTPFPGKPDRYASLITQTSDPYLYASKRFRIPFGWYANPIPSTCATAWIIMVADGYDPFRYGGKLD